MPERTCIACRAVRDKAALARLTAVDGALKLDDKCSLPGRGAYVCRDAECIKAAYKRRECFGKALKRAVTLPEESVLRGLILK